ncbi:hypothetical protein F6X40_30265 [Paraburkholderia sp. UCT31]|uniref:hypothetical protein n=1 Tax=Paraburkholderia sp. UCT31 TaxID=2615209 RepID=UPI0016555F31|nr:hypothetical protein [Paraburkholderia sp. UCT31]MBC8740907.1 hypothetical protein [Paraburkholderia sp. UCT31]
MNRKLLSMIALLWIGLVLIGAFGAWQARSSMLADRREQLLTLVQQAESLAGHYYRLAQKVALSDVDARRQALAALADCAMARTQLVARFRPLRTEELR